MPPAGDDDPSPADDDTEANDSVRPGNDQSDQQPDRDRADDEVRDVERPTDTDCRVEDGKSVDDGHDPEGTSLHSSGDGQSDHSSASRTDGPTETESPGGVRWLLRTDHPAVTFAREFVGSMFAVVLVGLLLFAISGVWPPMVAVESGSMEPHMYRGDLIFVMEEHRLAPAAAVQETGVATYQSGQETGYRRFGSYGDVIIFKKNGGSGTPIIHRARFWVSEGENWIDRADPSYLRRTSCDAVPNCPAPHAGFITKGDNHDSNPTYDQVSGISSPVKPEWIKGTAEFRIPWLGHIRLQFSSLLGGADHVAASENATRGSASAPVTG